MIYSTFRIIKFAFQNFIRNIWLSIATLIVMVILLVMINIIIGVNQIKTSTIANINKQINIELFFKQSIQESEVINMKRDFEKDKRIESVRIITPDQNLALFKERQKELAEKILQNLSSNPMGYSLIIKAFNINSYNDILNGIEQNEKVSAMLDQRDFPDLRIAATKISAVTDKINAGAIVLALLFFVIAVIIISNSIRVSVYTHREEIAIMKLVGATNSFVRMPFLVESILYAIIAVGITWGCIFLLLSMSGRFLTSFLGESVAIDLFTYYNANIIQLLGMQFAGVLVLHVLSTSIAIRRYLRI